MQKIKNVFLIFPLMQIKRKENQNKNNLILLLLLYSLYVWEFGLYFCSRRKMFYKNMIMTSVRYLTDVRNSIKRLFKSEWRARKTRKYTKKIYIMAFSSAQSFCDVFLLCIIVFVRFIALFFIPIVVLSLSLSSHLVTRKIYNL